MARLREKLIKRVVGDTDITRAGLTRSFRGLREGDRGELLMGLALTGLAYMRRSRPKRELVYRQEVKKGAVVVVRNATPGQPPVEIRNPKS